MNYGIPGTRVTAYTFEADYHCIGCTKRRFGADEFGSSYGTDSEGNEIHPTFTMDEQPIHEQFQVCATCGLIICLTCGNTDNVEHWLRTRKCTNCGTTEPEEEGA